MIIYLTNARIPTEKAHGLAAMKLCEAFAALGAEVIMVVPWRVNPLRADPYRYYCVNKNFELRTLPSVDFMWLGWGQRFFFLLQAFSFSLTAAFWLFYRYGLSRELNKHIIFSHDHLLLFFASFFAPNIFYDIHDFPQNTIFYRRVLRKAAGLAVQTKWKVTKLSGNFGVPREKIVYWPNGVDLKHFDLPLAKAEARKKLNLPLDKKIALYTGQLFGWKGVETLVKAAGLLPGDTAVYIVGGAEKDIWRLKAQSPKLQNPNLVFIGQRPWPEMPIWLKSADVLVLPNTAKEKISLYYTSPMKLFEYMAAGRPIVASDIPSIREVVDETMVFFAKADDAGSFAETIQKVLADNHGAGGHANRALEEVRKYTWAARAKRILLRMKA